jgi:hypothetical protein
MNLGSRLKALGKSIARKFPPAPPANPEFTPAEFAWWTGRLLQRVQERRAASPAERQAILERHRLEDNQLATTHPHLAPGWLRKFDPVERHGLFTFWQEWMARRAAQEVHLDGFDLTPADHAAVLAAIERLDAELGLPPLPGGKVAFTTLELQPHLSPEVFSRLTAAQAGARAAENGTTNGTAPG